MEISEDLENGISPASQARPPANTTRARNPRAPSSGVGTRAHPPVVPAASPAPTAPAPIAHIAHTAPVATAAPGAASYSNPVHPSSFEPIHRLKLSLPRMRRADERFLLPESRYSMVVNATIYTSLKAFLVSVGETEDATFPWWRVIQDFVHLYFEHFDHEYPVVHPYALEFGLDKTSTSWMLLLAVVTVGSQYSAFSNASLFSAAFGEILSHAITQNVSSLLVKTPTSY
ncbi:hypothetical protein N7463_002209 [Penicillium fimorum]|uniref:Uncharacterized protein n=1 Tax=Penicillium fimorum TaxID=1882269 RepID=A0A9X0C879_9EURO|nr:hypothetical protein N7463_002209 [Penicillium fimorum]